jgi:uncharacterized protein (PEP-CTERM system associated)
MLGALAIFLGAGHSQLLAQEAVGGRGFTLSTSIESGLAINHRSSTLDGSDGTDVELSVRPGLQISSRAGRLRGSLSYSFAATRHTKRKEGDGISNLLSAAFDGSVVDGWMYINGSASISQQNRSAFGEQSVGDGLGSANPNRVEVGTASVSPYVTGRLGQLATYRASLTGSATNTRRSSNTDSTTTGAAVALASPQGGTLLSWGLDGSWQEVDFRVGRTTETGRAQASLNIVPDIDWSLSLRAGQESTNVGSVNKENYSNWGASVRWTPSPRTSATFDTDRRYFGDSHKVLIDHRMSRSSIRFSSVRDVTSGANANTTFAPVTLYDLVFFSLGASGRDAVEQERLTQEFFRVNPNPPPTTVVGATALATGVAVVRREDLAFTHSGVRATLSLLAFVSDSKVIDNPLATAADAAVRQWGYTGSIGYRLTSVDSISLTGSHQRTLTSGTQLGNDLKSIGLGWSSQLGRRTTLSANARYAQFSSATNPYRESSVNGSLSMRF